MAGQDLNNVEGFCPAVHMPTKTNKTKIKQNKNRGQHNRILNFPVLRLCYIPAEPSVLRPRRVTRMHHPSHVPVVADYIIGDALRWGSDAPPVGGGSLGIKSPWCTSTPLGISTFPYAPQATPINISIFTVCTPTGVEMSDMTPYWRRNVGYGAILASKCRI